MNFIDAMRYASSMPTQQAKPQATFDGLSYSAEGDMEAAELSSLRIDTAAAVAAWTETSTEDLETGETLCDRFDALLVGIVDADKDGELDQNELDVLDIVYNIAAEIFISKGASEDDVDAMLNDGDDTATDSIHELLVNTGVDGEDAELEEINGFAFDSESDASVMDATYKRKVAIRNGKKTIIRKRISGRVRLSAKQKVAIRKAQRKAHSGAARMKRLKSLRKRKNMGL